MNLINGTSLFETGFTGRLDNFDQNSFKKKLIQGKNLLSIYIK